MKYVILRKCNTDEFFMTTAEYYSTYEPYSDDAGYALVQEWQPPVNPRQVLVLKEGKISASKSPYDSLKEARLFFAGEVLGFLNPETGELEQE